MEPLVEHPFDRGLVQLGACVADDLVRVRLLPVLKGETGEVVAECVNFTRWLGDHPGNLMTPAILAEQTAKAAKNTKNLTRDFEPFVLQKSLNDFYIEYELNVYTKQPEKMALMYSEIHKSILGEFNKAGVEIMSPHYSAFRDGNASTIPETDSSEKPVPGDQKPPVNPVNKIIDKLSGK